MRSALFVAALLWSSLVVAQEVKPNVTGKWKMTVETTMGNGNPVFELKQPTDSTITGTYKGQLGDAPVEGTLKGKKIHLEFTIQANLVVYDGTVDGDSMKGLLHLGTMAEGSFTGIREKP